MKAIYSETQTAYQVTQTNLRNSFLVWTSHVQETRKKSLPLSLTDWNYPDIKCDVQTLGTGSIWKKLLGCCTDYLPWTCWILNKGIFSSLIWNLRMFWYSKWNLKKKRNFFNDLINCESKCCMSILRHWYRC